MKNLILKILFVISTTRVNKKGLVPLYCRITYNGKEKPLQQVYLLILIIGIVNLKKLNLQMRIIISSIHN